MKFGDVARAYAGIAVRAANTRAPVTEVRVNGRVVDASEVLRTAAEQTQPVPVDTGSSGNGVLGWTERVVAEQITKVAPLVASGRATLDRWVPGSATVSSFFCGESESVSRTTKVEVKLANGEQLTFVRRLPDLEATAKLKRFSRTFNGLALVPIIGGLTCALAAVLATTFSVSAGLSGDLRMAGARAIQAAKFGAATVLNYVPVIGNILAGLGCIADNDKLAEVAKGYDFATVNPFDDLENDEGPAQLARVTPS